MTVYLDCNATTPIEPAVAEEVLRFLTDEFGNAGSRSHEFGARAKRAVQRARDQVAEVVKAKRDEVIFTSGATESNNLAILGLAEHARKTGRRHVVSTQIEHKAVLEPLAELARTGFEVTLVTPNELGWVSPAEIGRSLRSDTLLVSVMHVNNETGVIQPIEEIAQQLEKHDAFFHVDAAQSFGKVFEPLQSPRIDLISVSGHKIHGPMGVGALIARRRGFKLPPLRPLLYGGGQERGLRPGTLPVPLVVGLGLAAEIALRDREKRREACLAFRARLLDALLPLTPVMHGDPDRTLHNTLNLRFPGLDSEAVMVALRGLVAISNGSACTSASYEPSHVLKAMGLGDTETQEAIRLSWCHLTKAPDWERTAGMLTALR